MKTIVTLYDYCKEVNIPPPKHSCFDIRRFEDKVKTENAKQAPIRHEFYAIAIKHIGQNKSVNGEPLNANLFFNSPYQVVSWDVLPAWKGWYIMFDHNFIALSPLWENFIVDFPFFRLDTSVPFDLPPEAITTADKIFENIFLEYHSENEDKFQVIQSYTSLLLLIIKRQFKEQATIEKTSMRNRSTDLLLLSRFQTLIARHLGSDDGRDEVRQPSFYADKLNIHPNHLNAVAKRITGKTAGALIADGIVAHAKSLLRQTKLSIKEVAFELRFKEPTHFTSYFKKATGLTPNQYRDNPIL